ncbi:MAG: hypothetical protein HKN68_06450 [Saprospiraceae bacterium]|nr:hypothetical protein [Saprospiraceae bacterium]
MKNLIILIIVSILINGCAFTQDEHKGEEVFIMFSDQHICNDIKKCDFEISAGNFQQMNFQNIKYLKVNFDSVIGGRTMLFGKIKIKESNGRTADRFKVSFEDTENWYSIEELLKLESVLIKSNKVYIINNDIDSKN